VVNGDGVQQLGADIGFECGRPFLDQPQAKMDVSEQASLVGLPKGRRRA
jgi:hypothetical protein